MRFVLGLAFALDLLLGMPLGVRLGAQVDRGRPVILLVHGRGMLDRDTAATRRLWVDGLRTGAGAVTHAPLFDDRDVRVVWYADILDPASDAGCDYPPNDPRSLRAARGDDGLKSIAGVAGSLFGALAKLADDQEAATQMRQLAGDASFLSDARKRCASEARLDTALARAKREGRPVILVAHSLGSLLAYDDLSVRRDSGLVSELATLGSPLGSPGLRALLIGGDDRDTLTTLPGVREWINIRNENDPFARPVPLAHEIINTPPADEPDPHELVGYLRERETARAVLAAWCKAFTPSTPAPAGCADVTR